MKNNKIINSIKNFLFYIFYALFVVATFTFLFWLGIKGIVGFIVGTALISYLILSGNPLLYLLIDKFSSKDEIKNNLKILKGED
jgi:hypothetical protein